MLCEEIEKLQIIELLFCYNLPAIKTPKNRQILDITREKEVTYTIYQLREVVMFLELLYNYKNCTLIVILENGK